MPEFLSTADISSQLERVIRQASERLWLISPFLKVNPRLKQLLEDTNRARDIDARVVYGKNDLQPDESIWLEGLKSIRTLFCKDLHAKCYLNESMALITSMNLYEYSQVHNYEMGVLVLQEEDPELYNKIVEEARLIMRASEEIKVTVERVPASENDDRRQASRNSRAATAAPPRTAQAVSSSSRSTPTSGFCIRCKADLAANPIKPYCEPHYRSWSRYKNPEYEEKYCHICGGEFQATMLKPLCLSCYRKYKDVFDFAA